MFIEDYGLVLTLWFRSAFRSGDVSKYNARSLEEMKHCIRQESFASAGAYVIVAYRNSNLVSHGAWQHTGQGNFVGIADVLLNQANYLWEDLIEELNNVS